MGTLAIIEGKWGGGGVRVRVRVNLRTFFGVRYWISAFSV